MEAEPAPIVSTPEPAHAIRVASRHRPSFIARLRRFATRVRALFNARIEAVPAVAEGPLSREDGAEDPRPALAVVSVTEPVPVPEAPKAASLAPAPAVAEPTQPVPKRSRPKPKGPTNKEMLERTLKTLERVEQRLHHLEREVTGIDEAVRKSGTTPADASDDDLAPPPSGFVGYI